MRDQVTKQNYQLARRKGQRNLRRLLVLFYLFLLFYSVLGYFVLAMLFQDTQTSWLWIYLGKALGMLIGWMFIIHWLWRFRRIARTLFALFSIVSLYAIKDMIVLLEVSFQDSSFTSIQYLFCALIVMKTILGIACMLKMRTDPYMRSIWSFAVVYEDALDEPEEDEEEEEPEVQLLSTFSNNQPLVIHLKENDRLTLTARKRIRINTWLLTLTCFGGFLFFYLFLTFMTLSNPEDIGLVYIHRAILLSTMFSILAWLLPLTFLFLYLKVSKGALAIAWCAEIIRFLYSIPTLYDVFTTQHYSLLSLFMYCTIEALRYLLYYKITMRILRDPFIAQYWSRYIKSEEAYD